MSFSPAARAAMRDLKTRMSGFDEAKHPRVPAGSGDKSGEFTSKDGGASEEPKATEAFRVLYHKRRAEGATKKQIIDEAVRLGHLDAYKQYINLRREGWRGGVTLRGVKVKKVKKAIEGKIGGAVEQSELDMARGMFNAGAIDHYSIETKVIDSLVQREKTRPANVQAWHGMSKPEMMFKTTMGSINLHYTEDTRRSASRLITEYAQHPLPLEVTGHTKNIYMSSGKNKEDQYWAVKYNNPGFNSAATGGTDDIVYYRKETGRDTMIHEMGHNVAKNVYGSADPGPDSKIGKLYDKWEKHGLFWGAEPPPTDYAKNSRAETLAEAFAIKFSVNTVMTSYRGAQKLSPAYEEAVQEVLALSRRKLQGG